MNEASLSQSGRIMTGLRVSTILGSLLLVVGAFVDSERIWANLLVVGFFLVSLGLGALVFIALTYISGAGWDVAFRRVPEAMASTLVVTGVAMLAVIGLHLNEYAWHPHGVHGGESFWFKELWLQPKWLMLRAVVVVLLWVLFARLIVGISQRASDSTALKARRANTRLSALFLVVFGLSFSVATVDWLMALEPMWFSTMWAVYQFSGMCMATIATIIILCLVLRSRGILKESFTDDHLHDLGKLLLGFSCFWMYIWFSQYMLIWYSNIPEETSWFIKRTHGAWGPIVVATVALNWAVPFLLLLPRPAKRNPSLMMKVAVLVLVAHWLDLYQVVFPEAVLGGPVFGVWEVAAIVTGAGFFGMLFFRKSREAISIPVSDPYLQESLHHHC